MGIKASFMYKIQQLLDELVVLNPEEKTELIRKLAYMNAEQIGRVEELLRKALKSQKNLLKEVIKDNPNFNKELNLFKETQFKKAYAETANLRSREIMKKLINLKKNVRREP